MKKPNVIITETYLDVDIVRDIFKNIPVAEHEEWISIDEITLSMKDDEELYLFAQISGGCIITGYAGTYNDMLNFREYDYRHSYTHYLRLPKIK